MTDHLDSEKRSRNMSRIRGKDTPLEIVVMRNIPVFRRRSSNLMVTMQKGWLGRMGSDWLVIYSFGICDTFTVSRLPGDKLEMS